MVPNIDTHGVPVIADVDGDGNRETLVAVVPDRLVALDADGVEKRSWRLPDLPVQWACGNFEGSVPPDHGADPCDPSGVHSGVRLDAHAQARMDRPAQGLFVTYPTVAFLDMESAILSGIDGSALSEEPLRQRSTGGPDMNGDGLDDILLRDLFERRTLAGRDGHDILPITMWAGYHTPSRARWAGRTSRRESSGLADLLLVVENPIGRQIGEAVQGHRSAGRRGRGR